MIRRKKTTILTDAKESMLMGDVKRMVEGILKVAPENMRLFKDETVSFLNNFFFRKQIYGTKQLNALSTQKISSMSNSLC